MQVNVLIQLKLKQIKIKTNKPIEYLLINKSKDIKLKSKKLKNNLERLIDRGN